MEVALITLGGLLIAVSFEVHYRYHSLAKKYYQSVLKEYAKKIMTIVDKMKDTENLDQVQLTHKAIDESEVAIEEIAIKRWYANFPNFLFCGIALQGVYIVAIGFFYEAIIELIKHTPILFFLIAFEVIVLIPITIGLQGLRTVTKID